MTPEAQAAVPLSGPQRDSALREWRDLGQQRKVAIVSTRSRTLLGGTGIFPHLAKLAFPESRSGKLEDAPRSVAPKEIFDGPSHCPRVGPLAAHPRHLLQELLIQHKIRAFHTHNLPGRRVSWCRRHPQHLREPAGRNADPGLRISIPGSGSHSRASISDPRFRIAFPASGSRSAPRDLFPARRISYRNSGNVSGASVVIPSLGERSRTAGNHSGRPVTLPARR